MRRGQRRSIERHLPVGVRVDAAVVLWRRERSARAAAAVAGLGVIAAGAADAWSVWLLAGAVLAAVVTGVAVADRLLLVQAGGHLALFRAGRLNHRAVALLRLVSPLTVERAGNNRLAPRWYVAGDRYRARLGAHTTIEPMVAAVAGRQPARSGSDPERASGV